VGRYTVTIIKDEDLTRIPGSVKPDSKKRVVLPSFLVREDIVYHIYSNSIGQIILDPQVTVPASEAWLFKNPEAIAAVQRGLTDAAQGKVSKVDLSTL
jgi:hypothetical protein